MAGVLHSARRLMIVLCNMKSVARARSFSRESLDRLASKASFQIRFIGSQKGLPETNGAYAESTNVEDGSPFPPNDIMCTNFCPQSVIHGIIRKNMGPEHPFVQTIFSIFLKICKGRYLYPSENRWCMM